MLLNKNNLALILSKLEGSYKRHLLQLFLSPEIVVDILFTMKKDIENKTVYNLGCGTGRFAIGSALIGAKSTYGIDIDRNMLDIAKENTLHVQHLTGIQLDEICRWQLRDALKLNDDCHTVIQFPPINTDILFFIKALEIAKTVYSIHKIDRKEELKQLSTKYRSKEFKVKRYRLTKGFLPEVILVKVKL